MKRNFTEKIEKMKLNFGIKKTNCLKKNIKFRKTNFTVLAARAIVQWLTEHGSRTFFVDDFLNKEILVQKMTVIITKLILEWPKIPHLQIWR